jgi:hypothetical protein
MTQRPESEPRSSSGASGDPLRVIRGRALVGGTASGVALVAGEPLSFWGGYDHRTGEITDRRHPLSGANGAGRVLILPSTRGSSTTTAVLLEAIKAGTAPVAIVSHRPDAFLALASIVAHEMYGRCIPVVVADAGDLAAVETGAQVVVQSDGRTAVLTVSPDRSAM